MRPTICKIFGKLSLVLIVALSVGCNDVFEEDISGMNVELLFPGEDASLNSTYVTFSWEELEEAHDYEIEIVSPSFDLSETWWADSLLATEDFDIALQYGDYQWRVRGVNGASYTAWTTRGFSISAAGSIEGENITLLSPDDMIFSNLDSLLFAWNKLDSADFYRWLLFEDLSGVPSADETDGMVTEDTTIVVEMAEGNWWWGIRAFTSNGTSSNVSYRQLVIDRTVPDLPILNNPVNEVVSDVSEVSFSWVYGEDDWPSHDILTIASDNELTQIIDEIETIESSLTLDLSDFSSGDYYWQIETFDAAGNSTSSTVAQFTIE